MVNTLVLHSKKTELGIGCISKELKNSYKVNFGLQDCLTVKKELINVIDTSHCKTVTSREYSHRILQDNGTLSDCIVGNELRHYVGIGWTTTRVITLDDLKKYTRVV